MARLILVSMALIIPFSEITASTEDDNYWEAATISNVRNYLSKEENRALLEQCGRFLNMPEMLSISSSPTKAKFEYVFRHIRVSEQSTILPELENTVIGSLICGLGGGSMLSVVFEKETKRTITVALIPDR